MTVVILFEGGPLNGERWRFPHVAMAAPLIRYRTEKHRTCYRDTGRTGEGGARIYALTPPQ